MRGQAPRSGNWRTASWTWSKNWWAGGNCPRRPGPTTRKRASWS